MSLVGTLAFYIEKTTTPPSEDKAENELFINELNGLALGPIIVHDDIPLNHKLEILHHWDASGNTFSFE